MEELIYQVIWLVKAGTKAYRKRKERIRQPGGERGGDGEAEVQVTADAAVDRAAAVAEASRELSREVQAFVGAPARGPAKRALQDVARGQVLAAADSAAGQAPRVEPWQLDSLGAGLQFHARMLTALRRLAAQREDPVRRGLLRDLDAVAMACYQPLLESQRRRGFPLATRQAVAFLGETPGTLSPLLARTEVAPVEVSARLQHDVLAWPLIAREVGRDLVLSTDGMLEQVRVAAGFPTPSPTIDTGYLTEDEVLQALSSWQLELSADAVGALLLGPSYLASLTRLYRSPDQPYKVRLVELQGARATSSPPADLRVQVASEVLSRMGFAAEAEQLTVPWTDDHPLGMEFFYPTGGGRFASVPEDLYLQPVRTLAGVIGQHQLPSLAGMHLLDIPDFHHSLDRQRKVERTLEEIRRGLRPSDDDPRVIVAACALAAAGLPEWRAGLMPVLRGAVVGGPEDADAPVAVASAGGSEGWLDPQVLRDALVLQDVFARRGLPSPTTSDG